MSLPNFGPIAQYNSLTDPNLQGFFSKNIIRRHLVTNGLINKKGSIVPDSVYKYKVAQKDQKKHYRQMLAQAIVQEALDIERYRQAQIRNELELTAKKELVRRMRGQVNVHHDVPPLWPTNLPSLRPSTAPIDKQESTIRSQSVSEVDDSSRPIVPRPPEGNRPNRRYRRRNVKGTSQKQRPKSAKERSPPPKVEQNPCRITLLYHGKGINIPFDKKVFDSKDEITVFQQHCGGENLIVYKGKLLENTSFTFESKRHKEFPFSLSLYINNTYDCRISTCCEYRHTLNVRVGGKKGKFSFIGVSGAKPCYKCIINEQVKRVTGITSIKQKTDDEYNDDFDHEDQIDVIPGEKNPVLQGADENHKNLEISVNHDEENYENDFAEEPPKSESSKSSPREERNEIPVIEDNDKFLRPGKREPVNDDRKLEIPLIEKENGDKKPKRRSSEDTEEASSQAGLDTHEWNVKFYSRESDNVKSKHSLVVQLQVVGDKEKSRKFKFGSHDVKAFQQGKVESFNIKTKDIGTPKYLIVSNASTGDAPDLDLEKVELYDEATKHVYKFYGQRIEKDEVATLRIKKDADKKPKSKPKLKDWKVIVYTSKLKGRRMAGTDARVYISMIGDRETEKMFLPSTGKNFENGQVDTFDLKNVEDIGKLRQIRIGHDNSGIGAGWHLANVILQDEAGTQYLFRCRRWLAKEEDDHQTERVLDVAPNAVISPVESSEEEVVAKKKDTSSESSSSESSTPTSTTRSEKKTETSATEEEIVKITKKTTIFDLDDPTKWLIKIYTSDLGQSDEGTDSNVSLVLFGTKGSSSKIWLKLDRQVNLYFEPGSAVVLAIDCKDIGHLEKIRVAHDASGISPHWHLEKIELQNTGYKDWYLYEANRWLSRDRGDGQLEIELRHTEYRSPDKMIITNEIREEKSVYTPEDMKKAFESSDDDGDKQQTKSKKPTEVTSDDEFDNHAKNKKKNKDKKRNDASDTFSDSSESTTASGSLFSKEGSPRNKNANK